MGAHLPPRGIRNNNPGNLRLSKTRWRGQAALQADPDFVVFSDAAWGLRALMRVLLTYHLKYGLDTAESIINRYAPPHENATDSYISHVARALKAGRRDALDLTDRKTLIALAAAIVRHENGPPPKGGPAAWYPPALYARAAETAFENG